MSHNFRPRPPRERRRVRFNIPVPHNPPPQSILRPPPTHQPSLNSDPYQPLAFRRSSLPDMRHSASHLQERRGRALVALKDMQKYLKEACEFHGDDSRRAISVLSVNALSALIAYLNVLRKDFELSIFKRDEKLLQNVDINLSARHPAGQLTPERVVDNEYERYAREGHRKRLRREAEHRLLEFVSKQLRIPAYRLRDMPREQREQRELDAFKDRLLVFNVPHADPQQGRRNSSAPTSPADRSYTTPQSPHTAPGRIKDELFPDGGDLDTFTLPGSSFDLGPPAAPASQPRLARQATPRYPRQSPYLEPSDSPYVSSQPYAQPVGSSPYAAPMNVAPSYSSMHATASSPYMQPMAPSSPYVTATPSSPYVSSNANTYNTIPPSTPPHSYISPQPGVAYSPAAPSYSNASPYPTTAPAQHSQYAHPSPQPPMDYKPSYDIYVPLSSTRPYTSVGPDSSAHPGLGNTVRQGQAYPQPLPHNHSMKSAAGQMNHGGLQNYPQERNHRG